MTSNLYRDILHIKISDELDGDLCAGLFTFEARPRSDEHDNVSGNLTSKSPSSSDCSAISLCYHKLGDLRIKKQSLY